MLKFTSNTNLSYDDETVDVSTVFPKLDLTEFTNDYFLPIPTSLPLGRRVIDEAQCSVRLLIKGVIRRIQKSVELIGQEVLEVTCCRYPTTHFRNGVWINGEELGTECLHFSFQLAVILFLNGNPKYGLTLEGTVRNIDDTEGHQMYLNYTFIMRRLYEATKLDLFDPRKMPLIARIRLRNLAMKNVMNTLSIPYEYFEISHFGEIYEKLQSFVGVVTKTDTCLLSPQKIKKSRVVDLEDKDVYTDESNETVSSNTVDPMSPCFYVSADRVNEFSTEAFYKENGVIKIYPRGTFLFRLATSLQENTAAFYTPQPLARALVHHTLLERCKNTAADDILEMTVLEPAMGTGALLIETINQMTDMYLKCKQDEIDVDLPQSDYFDERQIVRKHISKRNSYGVDLNKSAITVAQVCLWLNCLFPSRR